MFYLYKCDESNALESACVWESHEVNILNLPTIAPVFPHILFLQQLITDQKTNQVLNIIIHMVDDMAIYIWIDSKSKLTESGLNRLRNHLFTGSLWCSNGFLSPSPFRSITEQRLQSNCIGRSRKTSDQASKLNTMESYLVVKRHPSYKNSAWYVKWVQPHKSAHFTVSDFFRATAYESEIIVLPYSFRQKIHYIT